jgi:hypothetical protein
MSMKDDMLAFHNILVPDDTPFLDLVYLHGKLLERLKEKKEAQENG